MPAKIAKKTAKKLPQKISASSKRPPGASTPQWVKREFGGFMDALSGKGLHLPGDTPRPKTSPKKKPTEKSKKLVKKKSKASAQKVDDDSPPWDPDGEDDE